MSNSFASPWTIACQAPLSMEFPRQEYWSRLPFPPPGDLPNPGIEPASPALADRFFPILSHIYIYIYVSISNIYTEFSIYKYIFIYYLYVYVNIWASLVAQSVKNLPTVQETWVQSLSWADPLEKEMATHSTILAWKISWAEEPGGLQSMGSQGVGHDWVTNTYLLTYKYIDR